MWGSVTFRAASLQVTVARIARSPIGAEPVSVSGISVHASFWARRGELWESVPNIAKACGIGRDTTRTALQFLTLERWIRREKRTGGSSRYWALHPYLEPGFTRTDSSRSPLTESREDAYRKQEGTPTDSRGEKTFQESPPKKEPPRRNGNELESAPNGLHPTGPNAKNSPSRPSEAATRELAASIIANEGTDPESAIAAFPPEEVIQWAIDWHLENVERGWILNGSPIRNPEAALRRFLRKVAGVRSKRIRELGAGELKGSKHSRVERNTPAMQTVGAWFNRQPDDLWTKDDAEALEEISPSSCDLELMAHFYLQPKDEVVRVLGFESRRQSLGGLLKHWFDEKDKANLFAAEEPQPKPKPKTTRCV